MLKPSENMRFVILLFDEISLSDSQVSLYDLGLMIPKYEKTKVIALFFDENNDEFTELIMKPNIDGVTFDCYSDY